MDLFNKKGEPVTQEYIDKVRLNSGTSIESFVDDRKDGTEFRDFVLKKINELSTNWAFLNCVDNLPDEDYIVRISVIPKRLITKEDE